MRVPLSTLPREFTTARNRGVAIVSVEKPVAPAAPAISWNLLRKVGRTGLIARHGAHDRPRARSRHASTHRFISDREDHIPVGDLHSDRSGTHRPVRPRIGHCAPASGKRSVRSASVYIEIG